MRPLPKALAIAFIVDLGGTTIAAVYLAVFSVLFEGPTATVAETSPAAASLIENIVATVVGGFFTLLAGYVAGFIAPRTRPVVLGVLVAGTNLLLAAAIARLFSISSEPLLWQVAFVAVTFLAAVSGTVSSQHERMRTTPALSRTTTTSSGAA